MVVLLSEVQLRFATWVGALVVLLALTQQEWRRMTISIALKIFLVLFGCIFMFERDRFMHSRSILRSLVFANVAVLIVPPVYNRRVWTEVRRFTHHAGFLKIINASSSHAISTPEFEMQLTGLTTKGMKELLPERMNWYLLTATFPMHFYVYFCINCIEAYFPIAAQIDSFIHSQENSFNPLHALDPYTWGVFKSANEPPLLLYDEDDIRLNTLDIPWHNRNAGYILQAIEARVAEHTPGLL